MRSLAITTAAVLSAIVLSASGQVAHATTKNEDNKKQAPQTVTVERGDSLSKIAKQEDSTAKRIFYANKDIKDPDLIYPGDELKIPSKTAELTKRPIPGNAVAVAPAPAPAATPAPAAPAAPAPQAPAPAAPAPRVQRATPAPPAPVASGGVWDRLAACESGGNWSINTGNGFYGGLQFTPSSWRAVGGTGLPHQASRAEQIQRGKALQAIQGWGAWPACSAKLGLR